MKSSSLKLEAEFARLENQIEASKIEARKLKDAIAERESEKVRRRMKLTVTVARKQQLTFTQLL